VTHIAPVPRERRHTLHFLRYARAAAPVYLDSEVDMSAIRRHRDKVRTDERPPSWVTYVLHAAGRVLAAHPDANAALCGRLRPRIVRYDRVHAKLAFDKSLNGVRMVLAGQIRDVHTATVPAIQDRIDQLRDGDPAQMREFDGLRLLHRLPPLLGAAAFRSVAHSARKRTDVLGTLAVTSLGHRPVDAFHSHGGTTITLGVGRVTERAVVRDGEVVVAPVMRLSLSFDHRVIDGAEAADVLGDLVGALENFSGDSPEATEGRDAPGRATAPLANR
jgi:pyruvate/2-oxoglutarate dehydrogenase complex dihydrolipoamide acyltransferase (E2) component